MNKLIPAILACVFSLVGSMRSAAADFSTNFCDTTLRVDFVMSGDSDSNVAIAFSGLSKYKGWGGRRGNLDSTLHKGNAEICVMAENGDTLYLNPFCTLFQEWLTTADTAGPRAMEGAALLPFPRQAAIVSITMRNNRQEPIAEARLKLDPSDILIRDNTATAPLPHEYIYRGEMPEDRKINVAILAEGYTEAEMPAFLDKAREAVDAILEHQPFDTLAPYFNFIAVESAGADSGVSVPKEGIWRDTPFRSHFSTFYSDRYLTTSSVGRLYDALTSLPAQHIIVLANTEVYGGGGIFNFYTLTTAGNPMFRPVVVHEFGHSFAALADEYFYPEEVDDQTYPAGIEPWEPNITNLSDFSHKWQKLIDKGEAGLIEGAGYRTKGMWRGCDDCRMRTNGAEGFCPVCRRAIVEMVEWLTPAVH